tara:strand:+ start:342 stop:908 length:567 start_codon:yes stop_codon:yes gene_type:complete
MTTWPSSNKGSTAHTDSDDDKPRLARPEINKNISNVNDIIDTFNITGSKSDGQVLVYNSSTGNFELGTSNSGFITLDNNYKEEIASASSASTIAIDCSTASVFTITLSHNANIVLSNLQQGTGVSLVLKQDADSVANSVSIYTSDSTSVLFPGGSSSTNLSIENNQIDVVHVFYTGSEYLGTITNNFY